jgi:hypothetical protein
MRLEEQNPLNWWGVYWRLSLATGIAYLALRFVLMVLGADVNHGAGMPVGFLLSGLVGFCLHVGAQAYVLQRDGHYIEGSLAHGLSLWPTVIGVLCLGLFFSVLRSQLAAIGLGLPYFGWGVEALGAVLVGVMGYGWSRLWLNLSKRVHQALFSA